MQAFIYVYKDVHTNTNRIIDRLTDRQMVCFLKWSRQKYYVTIIVFIILQFG